MCARGEHPRGVVGAGDGKKKKKKGFLWDEVPAGRPADGGESVPNESIVQRGLPVTR